MAIWKSVLLPTTIFLILALPFSHLSTSWLGVERNAKALKHASKSGVTGLARKKFKISRFPCRHAP
jgi:hypothetical protein